MQGVGHLYRREWHGAYRLGSTIAKALRFNPTELHAPRAHIPPELATSYKRDKRGLVPRWRLRYPGSVQTIAPARISRSLSAVGACLRQIDSLQPALAQLAEASDREGAGLVALGLQPVPALAAT